MTPSGDVKSLSLESDRTHKMLTGVAWVAQASRPANTFLFTALFVGRRNETTAEYR
jgi:hypothetical protein